MFKSIGGFFRDVVAPIGLGIIGGPAFGPLLAATYSGINTGIKTGSPLAGLGSAGLSFGLSTALQGIKAPTPKSFDLSASASPITRGLETTGANVVSGGIKTAGGPAFLGAGTAGQLAQSGSSLATNLATTPASAALYPLGSGPTIPSYFDQAVSRFQTPISSIDKTGLVEKLPDFVGRQSPLTIAGVGGALQMAATPMEAPQPAPIPRIVDEEADGDYSYKGPLDRGPYTYADPEDIAYGRVTPGSYGYLGAKQGGVIKAQGGGVMMQSGPYNPEIEKRKATFRPTGNIGVIPPGISSFAKTQPGMTMKPQLTRGLGAPVAPTVPTSAAALPRQNIPSAALAPMPMSGIAAPQSTQDASKLVSQGKQIAKQLPQLAQAASQAVPVALQKEVQNLEKLPQKDINVNIDQVRNLLGLAGGGSIPSSTDLPEEEFASIGIYRNPDEYDTDKMMAEGGEVKSDKTLQENAFVIPADVVGHIGDGSSDAGAQRLQSYLGMNPQQYQAGGIMAGELQGPGGGMDDLIQTSIEGKRAAAVSPQEFVVPRDIVAELGQGSYDKGSNKLYALMRNVRKTKTGTTKQPAELTRGLGQLMRTAVG